MEEKEAKGERVQGAGRRAQGGGGHSRLMEGKIAEVSMN